MKYIKTFESLILEDLSFEAKQKEFDRNIGIAVDHRFLEDISPYINIDNVESVLSACDMTSVSENPDVELYVLQHFNGLISEQTSTRMLIAAIKHNRMDLIKKNVEEYGANVNFAGIPLARAASKGNLEIIKYLVKNGAKYNSSQFILSNASEKGHYDVVNYLLSIGTIPNRFAIQRAKSKKMINILAKKMDEIIENDISTLKSLFWDDILNFELVRNKLPDWFTEKWLPIAEMDYYTKILN